MKSRLLLLSTLVAATLGTAQAAQPDAQAQAAALLSPAQVSAQDSASASSSSARGDAQAQAAALLSGARASQEANASVQVAPAQADRPSLDAQAQAAELLSGTRRTVDEAAPTTARAEKLGDHPAVIAARTARGVDPNTFIVAHPARLQLLAASPSEKDQAVALTSISEASAAAGR